MLMFAVGRRIISMAGRTSEKLACNRAILVSVSCVSRHGMQRDFICRLELGTVSVLPGSAF
jgi:hypothetical protein